MKFEWLKTIEWQKVLHDEYLEIAMLIGIDKFVLLLETFQKVSIYFTTESLQKPLQEYINKNLDRSSRELARKVGYSERYVQKLKASMLNKRRNRA